MDEKSKPGTKSQDVKLSTCPALSSLEINKITECEVDDIEYTYCDSGKNSGEQSLNLNEKSEHKTSSKNCNLNKDLDTLYDSNLSSELIITDNDSKLNVKNKLIEPKMVEFENILSSDTNFNSEEVKNLLDSNQIASLSCPKTIKTHEIAAEIKPKSECLGNDEVSGSSMFTYTGDILKFYICPLCKREESNILLLKRHISYIHRNKNEIDDVVNDIKRKKVKTLKCKICFKHHHTFNGKVKWLNHIRDTHKLSGEGPSHSYLELDSFSSTSYDCLICMQSFDVLPEAKKHIQSDHPHISMRPKLKHKYTKSWACKICFKKGIYKYFTSRESIENHISIKHENSVIDSDVKLISDVSEEIK